jgi:transposase
MKGYALSQDHNDRNRSDGTQIRIKRRSMGTDQGYVAWTRRLRWCDGEGQSVVCGSGAVSISVGYCVEGSAGTFRRFSGSAFASLALERNWGMGAGIQGVGKRCGQRIRDDRQHHRSCASAQCGRCKKKDQDEAIGRSKGGLSTKIHATVDALGNPTGFHLTGGQACDLDGADRLLLAIASDTVLADKGYDADARFIEPLEKAGKTAVVPPKCNRKNPRSYDTHLYKARHLIENFFAKLKQFRAIATRYDKTARNFLGAIHLASSFIWLN